MTLPRLERIARAIARHQADSDRFAVSMSATDAEREQFWPCFLDEAADVVAAPPELPPES